MQQIAGHSVAVLNQSHKLASVGSTPTPATNFYISLMYSCDDASATLPVKQIKFCEVFVTSESRFTGRGNLKPH